MRKRTDKGKKLIRFHWTYLLMGSCFILSGYFINLIVFTSLIVVHELGHYMVAKILKFEVLEIVIYPYGGITKLGDLINRRIDEELLIALFGVIMQFLFYLVIVYLYRVGYVREYTYNLYTIYNNRMIFFNLLPIYPLDGGRIVNLLLGKVVSYNMGNKLTIVISIFVIVVIVGFNVYKINFSNMMIYFIMLSYIMDYIKKLKYLYNRFLLERYLYDIEFDKVKIIKDRMKMYKDREHIIYKDNKYYREKEVLDECFSK